MPTRICALVLACLSFSVEAAYAGNDVLGELQTLHAIYSKACLQPIERRLETNRLRIVGFFPEVRVRTVTASELEPYDPELLAFQNLNTPEEFQAAEQRLQA